MSTPTLPGLPSLQMPAVIPGFRISKDQLTILVPAAVAAALCGYLLSRYAIGCGCRKGRVNTSISKDKPKVVDSFDMEDIGSKAVYCRCWRSKKFPYCDGAHAKHNDKTGDNVGPLIIKKRDA